MRDILSLLNSFSLHQHILTATHESNHTVDLISRQQSNLIVEHKITDPILSDHFAILASLLITPPSRSTPFSKPFRPLSSINLMNFLEIFDRLPYIVLSL